MFAESEDKMKRLSKKVAAKFKIIHECLKQNIPESRIVEILAQQFNQVERCQYLVLKKYHSSPELVAESVIKLSNGEKVYYNESKECYFCKSKESIREHHVSYNPQRIMNICLSCHNKLHFVIEEYHKNIKQKEEIIFNLNERLDVIQKAFNSISKEILPLKSEKDYEKN